MNERLERALNEQMNKEFHAGYLYLSMSAYFEREDLGGFSKWVRDHANEELEHAMKIFDFMNERGAHVRLKSISEVKDDWDSPLEAITEAYEHEKKVTKSIDELVDLAREEDDKATDVFLHWFIEEQVEEEDVTSELKSKLERVGEDQSAILVLDAKLEEEEH